MKDIDLRKRQEQIIKAMREAVTPENMQAIIAQMKKVADDPTASASERAEVARLLARVEKSPRPT
jgi:hypothetical protein